MQLTRFLTAALYTSVVLAPPGVLAGPSMRGQAGAIRPSAATPLTPAQMDHIIAIDQFSRHPEEVYRIAAIGRAVHYRAQQATGMPDLSQIAAFHNNLSVDPLSLQTYRDLLSPNGPPTPPSLSQTAQETFQESEGIRIRGTMVEKGLDLAFNSAALGASVLAPEASPVIGGAKILYPVIKDEAMRELEDVKILFKGPQAEILDEYARVAAEIRRGSEEGRAIAPYFAKLSDVDPKNDPATAPPVRAAILEMKALRSAKNSEEALIKVGKIQVGIEQLQKGVQELHDQVNERKPAPITRAGDAVAGKIQASIAQQQRRQEIAQGLQNAQGGFLLVGYLMQIAGDSQGTRMAFGLADAAGKVSNLVSNVGKMAPTMLMAGYVGVAMAVVSLLSTSQESGAPWAEVFAMLQKISKQIEDLHRDMAETLERMDARLGNLLQFNLQLTSSVKWDTQMIRQQLNAVQTQLDQMSQKLMSQNLALAQLILQSGDQDCLRFDGKRRLLEPRPDFIKCRDQYYSRAVDTNAFSTNGAPAMGALEQLQRSFPFASDYDKLRADLGMGGSPLVNPDTWYDSTTKLLLLVDSFPKYLGLIDLGSDRSSLTLDPIIQAGENIRSFLQSAAFTPSTSGPQLNRGSFLSLIDGIFDSQQEILTGLGHELDNMNLGSVRISAGNAQRPDKSYRFRYLTANSVGFCKDVKAKLGSMMNFSFNIGGDSHGHHMVIEAKSGVKWGRVVGFDRSPFVSGAEIFDQFASLEAREVQPGLSLLDAMNPVIALAEQIQSENITVVPCIRRFEVNNLRMDGGHSLTGVTDVYDAYGAGNEYDNNFSQTMPGGVQADADIAFDISVSYNGGEPILVSQLAGRTHVKMPFFYYFGDGADSWVRHAEQLHRGLWGDANSRFGEFLRPVPNEEADKNLRRLADRIDGILFQKQQDLKGMLDYRERNERIERLRRDLFMLGSIGLNHNAAAVDTFLRQIQDQRLLPSVSELVDRVVMRNHSIANELERMQQSRSALIAQLDRMAQSRHLMPDSTAIDARLIELKMLKEMRVRLATAKESNKRGRKKQN